MKITLLLLGITLKLHSTAENGPCSSKKIDLHGAGSSFPALLYNEIGVKYSAELVMTRYLGTWGIGNEYRDDYLESSYRHHEPSKVNGNLLRFPQRRNVEYIFDRKNSGHGRDRILLKEPSNPPVIFAASEGLLTKEQQKQNPTLLTFPVLAGALVIIYNVPEAERAGVQIVLTITDLVKIYAGQVKFWDDFTITEHNLNITLPHERIRVVARSDNAGDTGILTGAFSLFSKDWKHQYGAFSNPEFIDGFCCNSTKYPPNSIEFFAFRVTGMIGIVGSVPYTIGYAARANVVGFNVQQARLINEKNKSTEASDPAVQAAMDYHLKRAAGSLTFELSNALDAEAYPIASFSYIIVNSTTHPNVSCCQMQEIVGFVTRLFATSPEVFKKYSLVPLSENVKQKVIENGLKKITCLGNSVYTQYERSLILEKKTEIWPIVLMAFALIAFSFAVTVIYLLQKRRNDALAEDKWLLTGTAFFSSEMYNAQTSLVQLNSLSSRPTSGFNHPLKFIYKVGLFEKEKVFLEKTITTEPVKEWKRNTKLLVNKLRDSCNHHNIIRLLGYTEIEVNTYAVLEFLPKGTLHSVFKTSRYDLNDAIKYSIALDVANGLNFLHRRQIVHCLLNSLTCYVDSTWSVKIGSWYLNPITNEEDPYLFDSELKTGGLTGPANLIRILYMDPDIGDRSMRQCASDIYSFGILLIEIFTEDLPFASFVNDDKLTYEQITEDKSFKRNVIDYADHQSLPQPKNLLKVIGNCVGHFSFRMNIKELIVELNLLKPTKKGIVDMMMEAMEEHMDNLEIMVEERTAELQSMSDKMRHLLHEVLPPDIATKLFNGQTVFSEYFDCVTIFFSDIVGFTNISSRSNPFEVMTLLNDLWVLFDRTIETFDVYKVDTIGDAYMVCSGLPKPNGNDHCKNIADLALSLLSKTATFQIRHLPNEQLKVRIGINAGPVTAGVVGTKMPQYCVFGDAVNTASRMESTSLPLKIQVSSNSEELYRKHFPDQYVLEFRELISVKGKGEMKTYWLRQNE